MKNKTLIIQLLLFVFCGNSMAQVTQYPYLCSFETGPDNAVVVDNEPNWYGCDEWIYNNSTSISGNLCAYVNLTSSNFYKYLIYVHFDCSNQTNMQPSFWYYASNQHIALRILGSTNTLDWIVLKDWFIPTTGGWQFIDYTEMSNLSMFDNQQNCYFGITAIKNTGGGNVRLDDVQILSGGAQPVANWLTSASSSDWHTASNWDSGMVPDNNTDVTIPGTAAFFPVIGTANAGCNNLNIFAGGRLSINIGFQLDVAGDLVVASNATTDGSLLNNGTLNITGDGIYQRFINAYTNSADGWHLLSSPVNSFAITTSDFEPGGNDDLYQWDESSWQWLNYKTSPFDFVNGRGYLIAYENSGIRNFFGNFNNADIIMQDLSFGAGNGWQLLGNPFPCAIKWNDGNWNLNNIEGIAKIYDETAGNYIDLTSNSIIPSTQGFFVKAVSAMNSITIPVAARTHDATAYYKNENEFSSVQLKIESTETGFYDINNILLLPGASTAYDMAYDGHKMFGREEAPQMYMLCENDEYLSTNAIPVNCFSNIDIYIKAGTAGQHMITAKKLNTINNYTAIFLEDTFNDSIINLKNDSIYVFSASVDDPELRFRLRIEDASGDSETDLVDGSVYQSDGRICIRNCKIPSSIYIYNMTGKLIHSERISAENSCIQKELKNGIYLVRINEKVHKLIISHGL